MRFLLILSCVPALFAAQSAIHCEKLLDVKRGAYASEVLILVDAGKITGIGPASQTTATGGARIDVPGVCLPGLIDVHDHLTMDPSHSGYQSLGISVPRSAITGAKN